MRRLTPLFKEKKNEQTKIYDRCNSDRFFTNNNRIAMLRIEFTEPIEFKQQGVNQLATFVDCLYSTRHSAFTVLIYSGPGDFFIVKANQIEKTYAL